MKKKIYTLLDKLIKITQHGVRFIGVIIFIEGSEMYKSTGKFKRILYYLLY